MSKLKPISLKVRHHQVIWWLLGVDLAGPQSRQRARFLKRYKIEEAIKDLKTRNKAILEELAEKDEEGKPKMVEKEGRGKVYDLTDENRKEWDRRVDEILNEDVTLKVDESAFSEVMAAADIIINTKLRLDPSQAELHDQVCSAFEEAGYGVTERPVVEDGHMEGYRKAN